MGNNDAGRTKDAGYQIGVRKTVPVSLEDAWELLSSPDGLAIWLGPDASLRPEKGADYATAEGTRGQVRSFRDHDRIRVTMCPTGWTHDTTVQVALLAAASGTTMVFHQERLADSAERDRQRDHWRSVADRLAERLEDAHSD